MRRAAKVDDNQSAIVRVLRSAGCSVQILSAVGKGCPDIAVGRAGRNYLLEIKDGSKPPSQQRLTEHEQQWHDQWRGTVVVVKNEKEALEAVGL